MQEARKTSIVVVAAALAVAVALGSVALARKANAKPSSQSGPVGISAEILPQPNLPVKLDNIELRPDIVTHSMRLSYTVTNLGSQPLNRVSLSVLVFDSEFKTKMATSFTDMVNVAPGTQKQSEVLLNNLLYIDPFEGYGRYVVALAGHESPERTWHRASLPDLTLAMKAGERLDGLRFQTSSAEATGTCASTCLSLAQTVCGSAGIQTAGFSGALPNCTSSVTCRGQKPNLQ